MKVLTPLSHVANERGTWGTPEEEKQRVENKIVNMLEGTSFGAEDQHREGAGDATPHLAK